MCSGSEELASGGGKANSVDDGAEAIHLEAVRSWAERVELSDPEN